MAQTIKYYYDGEYLYETSYMVGYYLRHGKISDRVKEPKGREVTREEFNQIRQNL